MTPSPFDPIACRRDFPALTRTHGKFPVAFLDGPGGTQVPKAVLAAIREAYIERNANFDGKFLTSQDATTALASTRDVVAAFLGAPNGACISFGANMTSLNFALSHALARAMRPGDEVVITDLDHEANRGPWLMLQAQGIKVREVKLGEHGQLDQTDLADKISTRTRLVAMTIASNSLGTVPDVETVRERCQSVGAYLLVDAVHYAAHFPLDVGSLGADFLLCSAYKFYGPHVGVLYCRPGLLDELDTDRLRTQKQTAPHRFETGTLNHAAIAGVHAALKYLAAWGEGETLREQLVSAMQRIHNYEIDLARYYAERLSEFNGVQQWGPSFDGTPRAPTVSITVGGHRPAAIASHLARDGIQVWHGHFYALKLLEVLGLAESGGLLRVGISMYNTHAEIDRLITGLQDFLHR